MGNIIGTGLSDSRLAGFPQLETSDLLPAIGRRTPAMRTDIPFTSFPNGISHDPPKTGGRTATAAVAACPFGSMVSMNEADTGFTTGVRGGGIKCGETNFFLDPFGIDTETDGDWLIQIKVTGIKCTGDDANEIFLPGGIENSTGTAEWDKKEYSEGVNYDPSSFPSSPAGLGELVIGCGKLSVKEGQVKIVADGCGSIEITQCAGDISYKRV